MQFLKSGKRKCECMALGNSQRCRNGVSEYEPIHFTRDVRASFDVLGKACWTLERRRDRAKC